MRAATSPCRSFALCTLLTLPLLAQERLPDDRRQGAEAVTVEMCEQWLGTLASPEFEGRGTGQPGYRMAADYVAERFRELGLEARGDDATYFQHVPWSDSKIDEGKTCVEFRSPRGDSLRIPAQRLGGTASSALAASGPVLLLVAALPTVAPTETANAPTIPGLADVDATGKVVVVYLRSGEDRRAAAMARFAILQGLQGKKPAAVLFAQRDDVRGPLRGRQGAQRRTNPAAAGIARAPLDVTLGGADLTALLQLAGQDAAVLDGLVLATPIPLEAQLTVAIEEAAAPAMNVFAVLPGSDPQLRDQYVVVGSHLDHLGKRGDRLFPGADDDGSGTTGVLAVATMLVKNGGRPARSILFVCFSGEERGLIGSGWFADHCPVPLSSIVAELQMDMIGRDEEENAEGNKDEKAEDNRNSLHLVGTQKLAPELHAICLAANARAGFDLEYDEERMFGRSDHANFAQKGVPVAFFFTGLHRDYHQPSDTPDKIHYEKLLRVARYVYDIAFTLAQQPGRPQIDPGLWRTYRGKRGGEPAAPMKPASERPASEKPVSETPADAPQPADRGSR
ncbi:MAG: M28 family peptidase [Planctomycetes bacterium]|nr:M28 family peptidase [Planctomycetota bacterium]